MKDKHIIMYEGWISADLEEKEKLNSMGIITGDYNEEEEYFENCILDEFAFKILEPMWGRMMWGFVMYSRKYILN